MEGRQVGSVIEYTIEKVPVELLVEDLPQSNSDNQKLESKGDFILPQQSTRQSQVPPGSH